MTMRLVDRTLRFPDFYCIGVQKAGTTWLEQNLRWHGEVWLPPIKELHYFNDLYIPGQREWTADHRRRKAVQALSYHVRSTLEGNWNYQRIATLCSLIDRPISDAWLGEIFASAGADQMCGDITPEYSLLPQAGVAHLLALSPQARIVLIMRDPIERCWSQIRMLTKVKSTEITEEDAWRFPDVRQRSNYREILRRWRANCRPDQLFIGFTDEFVEDPLKFLQRVCEFLGITFKAEYFPKARSRIFEGIDVALPHDLLAQMRTYFESTYREMAAEFTWPCRNWLERYYL
jgi:Sulfotransferase family